MDNNSLKELFDEKIKGIYAAIQANADVNNEHFKRLTEISERIEKQTIKTNGRVTDLEGKVHELDLVDQSHIINCPAIPRIEKLEEKNAEFALVRKYPVPFIVGGVVFGAAVVLGFLVTVGVI